MRELSVKETAMTGLPLEFQKKIFSDLDKRFILILFCCLIVESLIVFSLSRQPVAEFSQKEIARIQERFAQFILKEDKVENNTLARQNQAGSAGTETVEEKPESGSENSGSEDDAGDPGSKAETAAVRHADRMATASEKRVAMTRTVSNKGLLGVLTASSSNSNAGSVHDVLGGAGRQRGSDLDDILAASDGLKSTGKSGLSGDGTGTTGVRGGRSGRKATTIDDLVTHKTNTNTQSLSRTGKVQVESPADVVGRGHKSIYRSGQELQRVIYDHYSAIKYCYERELKRHPSLQGKVKVRITVHADGHVEKVEIVNSTINNERVERCIITKIRRWKDFKPIDQKEGSVAFTQTFKFGS